MKSLFCCPNCGRPLEKEEHGLKCPKGHCFDLARSGYVNLLLSQKDARKNHGDDRLMIEARRDFLDGGFYAPMRETLIETALSIASPGMTVLDAGCGEGYYTAELGKRLSEAGFAPRIAAIDIAKEALKWASHRGKEMELAVASCFHLPLADESVNLLLSVFSPYCGEEFLRVLKPGGDFLMVIPLERHLWGLKEAVYEKPYPNEVKDFALPGFTLLKKEELRYSVTLSSQEEIHNLFLMTPYYYKTGAADQAKVAALETLKTPVEFAVLLYQKN